MSVAAKLCGRCGRNKRAPGQRWCRECKNAYAREHPNKYTERKRLWAREHRATCCDCGGLLSAGSKGRRSRRTLRCRPCEDRRRQKIVHDRAQRIVAWWAEGLTLKQIADRLGWTAGHIAKETDTLRALGYDLPYRRNDGQKYSHCRPVSEATP